MQEKAKANPKVKFLFNSEIVEILGETKVEKVKIKNNKTNKESEVQIDGIFVAIGHVPNTKILQGVDLDEQGFVKAHDHFKTNINGIFVAGDVHDTNYKQAITAAGYGCSAALEAEKYLREAKPN
jgi:thioredoxin reductase (NADPH)